MSTLPLSPSQYFFNDGTPRLAGGCRTSFCSFVHPDSPQWETAPEPMSLPRSVLQGNPPPRRGVPSRGRSPRRDRSFSDDNNRAGAGKGPKPMRSVTEQESSSFDSSSWGLPASSSNSIPRKPTLRNFEGGWNADSTSNNNSDDSWSTIWGSSSGTSKGWGDVKSGNTVGGESKNASSSGWGSSSGGWGSSSGGWGSDSGGWGSGSGWVVDSASQNDNSQSKTDQPSGSAKAPQRSSRPTVMTNVNVPPPTEQARRNSGSLISPSTPNVLDPSIPPLSSNTKMGDGSRAIRALPGTTSKSSRHSSVVSDVAMTLKVATPILPPPIPMSASVVAKLTSGPKADLKAKILELFIDAIYLTLQIQQLQHSIDQVRRTSASAQFGHISQAARDRLFTCRKNYDKALAEQRRRLGLAVENLSSLPDLASLNNLTPVDEPALMAYAVELGQWMADTKTYVIILASSSAKEEREILSLPMEFECAAPPAIEQPPDPVDQFRQRLGIVDAYLDDLSEDLDKFSIDECASRRFDTLTLPQDPRPAKLLELEQKIAGVDAMFKMVTEAAAAVVETHAMQHHRLDDMKPKVLGVLHQRQDDASKIAELEQLQELQTKQLEDLGNQARNLHTMEHVQQQRPSELQLPFSPEQLQVYADFVVDRFVEEELRPALLKARSDCLDHIKLSTHSFNKAIWLKLKPIATVAQRLAERCTPPNGSQNDILADHDS